jgi:putative tricarboxylic transport membrane protein
VHNALFDIWLMLGFGVMGYIFKKFDYPMAPMVLALVLGSRAEESFRQSMLISSGSLEVFFSTPLVAGITSLGILLLFWPLITKTLAAFKSTKS